MIIPDFSHAEQRIGQMLEENFPDVAFLKRHSRSAFYALMYGTSWDVIYEKWLRSHADEEGCSAVFAGVIYDAS